MRDSEYIAIKERAAGQLLKLPHVTAVGLGPRERDKRYTGEIAIKVFVRHKRPLEAIPEAERIPASIDGVPTDVEELGELRLSESSEPGSTEPTFPDINPHEVLRGGISLLAQGQHKVGTLGCLLRDKFDATAIYALTNHHVVSVDGKVSRSRRVCHPPNFEDSKYVFSSREIGVVAEAHDEPILDAAVVRLDARKKWIPKIEEVGFVWGSFELTLDLVRNGDYKVRKRGITTGMTHGVVVCLEAQCVSLFPPGDKRLRKKNIFVKTIDTNPPGAFSKLGDSGSVLVNDQNRVVGLHYASSDADSTRPAYGVSAPIMTVLRRLKDTYGLDLEVAKTDAATPDEVSETQTVLPPCGVPTIPATEQVAKGRHESRRPLKGGLQILTEPMLGHANAATLGCIVIEKVNDTAAYILTSYGAVSAEGTFTPTGATRVGQPELKKKCSGCCSDAVGKFSKGGPAHNTPAALVRLGKDQRWLAEIEHIGLVGGTDVAEAGLEVLKYGAATGLTGGIVVENVSVPQEQQHKVLLNSFLIEPHLNPAAPNTGEDIHFSRFVDRGAAIVNRVGAVVGVLYDEVWVLKNGRKVFHGVAAHITEALTALQAQLGVELKVDVATEPDEVRTASARVEIDSSPRTPEWSEVLPPHLTASPATNLLEAAWREHERELRDLIERNRRVATAWHRSGGPEMLQAIVRASELPDSTLPETFNGQAATDCLDRLAHSFQKFGSATLRADIARIRSLLPSPGGLSLGGWLDALNASLVPDGR